MPWKIVKCFLLEAFNKKSEKLILLPLCAMELIRLKIFS